MPAYIGPEHLAIMIPIITVLGTMAVVITGIIIGGKNKELKHRERMSAIEKGLPFPDEDTKPRRPVHSSRRAGGLVMLGIGIALTIALWTTAGSVGGVWGLIPLFIGVGLLIAATVDKREYEERERREGGGAPAPAPTSYGSAD